MKRIETYIKNTSYIEIIIIFIVGNLIVGFFSPLGRDIFYHFQYIMTSPRLHVIIPALVCIFIMLYQITSSFFVYFWVDYSDKKWVVMSLALYYAFFVLVYSYTGEYSPFSYLSNKIYTGILYGEWGSDIQSYIRKTYNFIPRGS